MRITTEHSILQTVGFQFQIGEKLEKKIFIHQKKPHLFKPFPDNRVVFVDNNKKQTKYFLRPFNFQTA